MQPKIILGAFVCSLISHLMQHFHKAPTYKNGLLLILINHLTDLPWSGGEDHLKRELMLIKELQMFQAMTTVPPAKNNTAQ